MSFITFGNYFFESTGIVLIKEDGEDKYLLTVKNEIQAFTEAYDTAMERDAAYDSLVTTLTAPP